MNLGKIEIGKVIEYKKTFTEDDVLDFAKISGDNNPIHLDKKYASESIFGQRVVHGILVTSMFSKIFGMIYPGIGGIYLSQFVKYLKPVFINEQVIAKVTLINFDYDKKRGTFKTECFKDNKVIVITGEAGILFPEKFE
tara:strand:- start:289 stop:705 length:417 start_codon:yes stop_codon:yes gene_type:complete